MKEHPSVMKMWEAYLESIGERIDHTDKTYTSWHFELTEKSANNLARLVKSGQKQATASCLWSFEHTNEPVPKKGDYSIITNWDGEAECIIQTTHVEILPYKNVTEELARKEGEGDLSLAYWREVHLIYYKAVCEELGREFTEELPVVFEEFEVVFQ